MIGHCKNTHTEKQVNNVHSKNTEQNNHHYRIKKNFNNKNEKVISFCMNGSELILYFDSIFYTIDSIGLLSPIYTFVRMIVFFQVRLISTAFTL